MFMYSFKFLLILLLDKSVLDRILAITVQPGEELPVEILRRPGTELCVVPRVEGVHLLQKSDRDRLTAEGSNHQVLLGEFLPLPADVAALILVEAPEVVLEAGKAGIFPHVALMLPGNESQLLHDRQPLRVHVVEAQAGHVVLPAQPVYGPEP